MLFLIGNLSWDFLGNTFAGEMANFDAEMQTVVLKYVLPISAFILSLKLCKRQYRKLYQIAYACILNRIGENYNKKFSTHKKRLFEDMWTMSKELGRPISVLEVGAGSGTNFQFFPGGTNVICVDPNPHFDKYLIANKDKFTNVNFKEFVVGKGEDLSLFPNNSVDAVVCTLVLCSVDDVDMCISEFKRILKKGGKFFYLEHVCAEKRTLTYLIQWVLSPVWKVIGDGCHLQRTLWINVENGQFESVNQERFNAKLRLIPIKPHLVGVATK